MHRTLIYVCITISHRVRKTNYIIIIYSNNVYVRAFFIPENDHELTVCLLLIANVQCASGILATQR